MTQCCGGAFQAEETVNKKALRGMHAWQSSKKLSVSKVHGTLGRVEQNEIKKDSREPETKLCRALSRQETTEAF